MHMQGHGRTVSVESRAVDSLVIANPLPRFVDEVRSLRVVEILVFASRERFLSSVGVNVVPEVA